jgi:GNAT superfamily N-acetyltransferase
MVSFRCKVQISKVLNNHTRFQLAQLSDLEILLPLMRAYYAFDTIPFDEARARSAMSGLLANPEYGLAWLIDVDGALAGYTVICFGYSLEFGGRDAFLDELYLYEPYRGRGIGTQAMNHMIAVCLERGIHAFHLEVTRDNHQAIAYYLKMGFAFRGHHMMSRILS